MVLKITLWKKPSSKNGVVHRLCNPEEEIDSGNFADLRSREYISRSTTSALSTQPPRLHELSFGKRMRYLSSGHPKARLIHLLWLSREELGHIPTQVRQFWIYVNLSLNMMMTLIVEPVLEPPLPTEIWNTLQPHPKPIPDYLASDLQV